jgi:hypothetical protein
MNDFLIHRGAPALDGPMVAFGPESPSWPQLVVPASLARTVTYTSNPLTVVLECRFDQDKLQLKKVQIENFEGFVSSRDLTQLKLPVLMRAVALESIPGSGDFLALAKTKLSNPQLLRENLLLLAQVYWLENVTWGSPRKTIMEFADCSRSTASEYIRLADKAFGLPKERLETFDPYKARRFGEEKWLIPDPDSHD